MILNYLKELNSKIYILASSSPRRKEILQKLGIGIQIIPSNFEENLNPDSFGHPSEYVKKTAIGKAKDVMDQLSSNDKVVDVIISADTCVTIDGKVFGKPKDNQDAVNMLSKLNGRSHEVITGVCMFIRNGSDSQDWRMVDFHETTTVTFASMSLDLIKAYIDTGEPMDKAGAYGIQGLGGTLIEGIRGDYYNVMGFPLHRFTHHLLSILNEWSNQPVSSSE